MEGKTARSVVACVHRKNGKMSTCSPHTRQLERCYTCCSEGTRDSTSCAVDSSYKPWREQARHTVLAGDQIRKVDGVAVGEDLAKSKRLILGDTGSFVEL